MDPLVRLDPRVTSEIGVVTANRLQTETKVSKEMIADFVLLPFREIKATLAIQAIQESLDCVGIQDNQDWLDRRDCLENEERMDYVEVRVSLVVMVCQG